MKYRPCRWLRSSVDLEKYVVEVCTAQGKGPGCKLSALLINKSDFLSVEQRSVLLKGCANVFAFPERG